MRTEAAAIQVWEWEGGQRAPEKITQKSFQELDMQMKDVASNACAREAMEKDCRLIFEGIRRLIDGTCCLQGEEMLCVWDLFHKIHQAFSEHVSFEEEWVLPRLPEPERSHHLSEHFRLRCLIEDARWEFESANGDRFREILRNLASELKAHHECDKQADLLSKACRPPQDRNFMRIAGRAERALLD